MDAFAEQVLELLPYLRNLAYRLTVREADREDLVQDTLERALRKSAHFDGRNLQGWLGTLMHNQAVNLYRRAQVRRADALEAHPSLLVPGDVERQAIARLELRAVLAAEPELARVILCQGTRQGNRIRSRLWRARRRARRLVA